MTDDEKGHDAADWLASQFGSPDPDENADAAAKTPDAGADSGPSPAVTPPVPAVPPLPASPPAPANPPTRPAAPPQANPAATPPAATPPAATQPAAAAGGFQWGLTPRSTATPPPPVDIPVDGAAEKPTDSQPSYQLNGQSGSQPAEPVETPAGPPTGTSPVTSIFAPPPTAGVTPPPTLPSQAPPPTVMPPVVAPPSVMPQPVAPPPPIEPPELVAPPEPQPLDASLAGAPSLDAEPRTMALPWESAGTELFTPAAAGSPVAEPATELLSGFETADAAAESSVDALFGEQQFRDYEPEPGSSQNPFVRGPEPAAAQGGPAPTPRANRAPLPRQQKVLLWIAGGLAALLVLVGLFFLGTKLPHAGAASPVVTPTVKPSPTPSPSPTPAAVGPVAPGSYKWDRLLGGECLAPFDSPWAEKFTVVDCATPHPAQLVARGTFVEPTAAATDPSAPASPAAGATKPESSYPGVEALQAQINLLCSAPTVIDFAAAGAYSDIQFTASYPANDKQWSDGDHNYYCFVTRSSGEPLTTSVAVVPAAS